MPALLVWRNNWYVGFPVCSASLCMSSSALTPQIDPLPCITARKRKWISCTKPVFNAGWKAHFEPLCLICCLFLSRVFRVNRKPEKSEHKLLQPASPLSLKQPSYGGWAPQPLTLIQPFPSHHPPEQFHALQRSTSPSTLFKLQLLWPEATTAVKQVH